MARTQLITCDICGKSKGDVNHWWKFWITTPASKRRLVICPFDDIQKEMPADHKDACSETCISTAVSRWTSTGTFEINSSSSNDVQS
jgi:hypothetical protein